MFCVDIDHANRMRQALINENADLVAKHWNYCVKITGDDEVGKQELDNFTDVEERFPVIATTSKMLTTGIDTKMVKVIVLESNIHRLQSLSKLLVEEQEYEKQKAKCFLP
ncbi:type I restriction-modification system restriction subunit R [Algibacter lectus]|uniref:Type I restriction-modification system restriction subunit R n=1 Tax=Algibacter lectus TaxID=221126 RepID=A0A090X5R8_9FLAO|nr:type I restriction-modification system restriction subunit R [Algibacter lectus]